MKKRTIAALVLAALVVGLAAAAGGAAAWLFYTEAGLAWIAARASAYGGEGLTLDGVAGTLAGGMSVRAVRFAGKDMELVIRDAGLRVSPLSLVMLKPRITGLRAAEVTVTTKPGTPREKPPDTLALPADLQIRGAAIERLTVDTGSGPIAITNARLDYSGGRSEHRVDNLSLSVMGLDISLHGRIAAAAPFPLDAAFKAVRADTLAATITGTAKGTLAAIELEAQAQSADARVTAAAAVHQYEKAPLARVKLHAERLDLHAFVATLPQTRIDAQVSLERKNGGLSGPIALTNAVHGPYDKNRLPLAALRATLETDFNRAAFTALTADLGAAGSVAGSGKLAANAAQVTLTTRDLNLAGAYSKLRATHLRGAVQITLENARQSVTADLSQDDIAVRAAATHSGDTIDITRFEARARGGSATGSARLSTTKPQPFSLKAAFARFDPAAWGAFPAGSLNGELSAQGTIAGPAADVALTLRDSRWMGAPLAGRGSAGVAADRVRNADVDLTLGKNHVSAKGAFGGPGDVLAVVFDAAQPSLLVPALAGTLRGRAEVSGTLRAPRVQFDVTGSGVAYAKAGRVNALEAKGTLDMQAGGRIDVTARATGIVTREAELKSASLRLEGTRASHTANVDASGRSIDFHARAAGAWDPARGWSGTVQELVNRGEVALELAAPVRVAVGRGHYRADAFTLRAIGGRLDVTELASENGRLATAGRFSDFPVKPVLALAGRPADIAGTLRLSGQWSVRTFPRLTGSIKVTRESGDLSLGPKSPVAVGLQTLDVDATFGETAIDLRANVRSALATATAQGTIRAVGGAYNERSPIELTAEADIAQLSTFTAFIDTPMLVRGEAHARLRGSGTLGDPQITGPITADGLAIALPAEGVDLTGGTLRAVLTRSEVKVESFSIRGGDGVLTASGTLARSGFDRASLDWEADRFRVLSRPNRRLVVSGKGNAALESGKLSFTGKVTANEGLFDIGETTLAKVGDDVVIVGRGQPGVKADPQPKTLARVSVDLTIDFGNRVQVKGHGLEVWLSGNLHVYTDAKGQILGKGTVSARNGTFVAYGQRLEIDRGVFYFNGAVSNPGLDVVAMRKRQAVEAGVAITGTLKNPFVRIVSDPSVPEGEALSWLVLGHGPSQANAGQLAALPIATNALLGKATKRIGVDELGVRGSGSVGEQFVTVGKRISDRLYVYFEQGLGNTATLLRLELTLTRRVVARLEAGTASTSGPTSSAGPTSSVGLYYRYKWD